MMSKKKNYKNNNVNYKKSNDKITSKEKNDRKSNSSRNTFIMKFLVFLGGIITLAFI